MMSHSLELGNALSNERGRQFSHNQLRRFMGLPEGRLPVTTEEKIFWVGNTRVLVLTREQAKERYPNSRRPHRVLARCPRCMEYVGAGKLHQHMRSQHCKDVVDATQEGYDRLAGGA